MAKFSGVLKKAVEQAKGRDSYWVESAKLQFAVALEAQRKAADMTYKAVADKLGTSAAYITKVFRGDSNMTIESMVKLARATGGRLEVQIVDAASDVNWNAAVLKTKVGQGQTTTPTATIIAFPGPAANHAKYGELLAA